MLFFCCFCCVDRWFAKNKSMKANNKAFNDICNVIKFENGMAYHGTNVMLDLVPYLFWFIHGLLRAHPNNSTINLAKQTMDCYGIKQRGFKKISNYEISRLGYGRIFGRWNDFASLCRTE